MRLVEWLALCALVVALSGCSATWSTAKVGSTPGTETAGEARSSSATDPAPSGARLERAAAAILITEGDVADRPYRILGDIEVTVNKTTIFHQDPTPELVNRELRKEAAKLGADAVIQVRYGTVGIS